MTRFQIDLVFDLRNSRKGSKRTITPRFIKRHHHHPPKKNLRADTKRKL
jgi:hypothetical protein